MHVLASRDSVRRLSAHAKSSGATPQLHAEPGPLARAPSIAAIRPKLKVDQPGDEYEREADAIADGVMPGPAGSQTGSQACCSGCASGSGCSGSAGSLACVQRQATVAARRGPEPSSDEEAPVRSGGSAGQPLHGSSRTFFVSHPDDPQEREAKRLADQVAGTSLKPCDSCPGHALCIECADQATAHRTESEAPASPAVMASQGGGRPLSQRTRMELEPHFGWNFGAVRVHTGEAASRSADKLAAHAFTLGSDITFAAGRYAPDTMAGRRLLAHELAHVVQQSRAARSLARADRQEAPGPVADAELEEALEAEQEAARSGADQDDDVTLRAQSTRALLLLQWGPRPTLLAKRDVTTFANHCLELSQTEWKTLGVLSPARAEAALMIWPKGFPLYWSGRVHEALTLGYDPAIIVAEWRKWEAELARAAVRLGPAIFEHGLPVPLGDTKRLDKFVLRLSDGRLDRSSPVRDFARLGARHLQLKWVGVFFFSWETMVNRISEQIADGRLTPNVQDWQDFVKNKQSILRDLPTRARERYATSDQELTEFQSDAFKLADGALFVGNVSALFSIAGIFTGWGEISTLFEGALASADEMVAGAGGGERLVAALTWAWENDYFSGAAAEWVQNLINNGPEILKELATIIVLGMIPGVNVAVATYLLLSGAADVIGMLGELAAALIDVTSATTVGQLQRAAQHLARVLVNGGITILIVLATAGIGKAAAKLRKRSKQLRAKDPRLTDEAATKKAFDEMPAAERRALQSAELRVAKKFEEFASVCHLGSINCRFKLPDQVLNEAGAYPTARPVPKPVGPFIVRKSILSGVQRGTETLRDLCRANRKLWPEFDKALAAAEAKGSDWPRTGGVPWEVHHVKPVFMGGDNAIVNLYPLTKGIHQEYTHWWTKIHNGFKRRFTEKEWGLIYGDKRDVPGSAVPKTRVR